MRQKIEFNETVDNVIIESFNNGLTQSQIREKLEYEYNFKVGTRLLSERFKTLGLNGNQKIQRQELKAWRDVFTNDEFPNKITNSIINDLCWNWKLDEIAKEHNTKVEKLLEYIDPSKVDSKLKRRFNAFQRIYNGGYKPDLRVYTDKEREEVFNYISESLKDYTIIKDYKVELWGVEYTFDFYCKETNQYFVGGGASRCLIPLFEEVGINAIQINNFHTDEFGKMVASDLEYQSKDIVRYIQNGLIGLEERNRRPKGYVAPTESEVNNWVMKRELEGILAKIKE